MARTSKIERLIANAEHFKVNPDVGLNNAQVKRRTKEHLTNKVVKRVTKSYLRIFYENVVNAWNLLLFSIAALMIYARIEIVNFAFLLVLVINIIVGLYQDIRARKLVDKLKVLDYPKVTVLRNGKLQETQSNKIVLDELVSIKTGNQIPCDGVLVKGTIEVNESMLTGEPANISKTIGDTVYSGSYVTAGTGLFQVQQLGKANYAEKLQSKARKFKKPKSEILSSIRNIFKSIGGIVFILAIALFLVAYKSGALPFKFTSREYTKLDDGTMAFLDANFGAFSKTIRSISGALVAMVPIGMYLLTTITLAVGVIRLANKRMLTQDVYCIEMLARTDVLCLDKTGTLTDGKMSVKKLITLAKVGEKDLGKMLITLVDGTEDQNATANAIREKFGRLNKFDIVNAIPFSSVRKYSGVELEDGRNIIMGAREFIPHGNKKIDKICSEFEVKGNRVLLIGISKTPLKQDGILKMVQPIGILVLEDHIRDDASTNIDWFKKNGVSVRIITGDNPVTAAEIARRAGIEGANKFISLEGMSIEEVKRAARENIIFGRVSPEQKEAIIQALKDDGHTVAMTGDGVNDILALRVADCSIAMASGSDAAKNVAHLVALDSNFSSLPDVVKEGRRVINNLQRAFSIYLVKTIFAIVLTVFFLIWGLIDKNISYPFETKNMYIWEMVNIGVGSLFLSLQPNEEKISSSFMANILSKVLPAAFLQIITVIVLYAIAYIFNGSFITTANVKDICVVLFSINSFIILVRICMPFDAYRTMLVIGLGFIDMIALFADYHAGLWKSAINKSVFGIDYSLFEGGLVGNKKLYLIILCLIVGVVIYIISEVVANKIHKYVDRKKLESKSEKF